MTKSVRTEHGVAEASEEFRQTRIVPSSRKGVVTRFKLLDQTGAKANPGRRQRPSGYYLVLWYATSVALLLLFPILSFGMPLWRLPAAQSLPFGCLMASFVLSAAYTLLIQPPSSPVLRFGWTIVATMAIFGVVFLGFVLTKADYSRAITLGIFTSALVLVPAPYFVGTAALHQALALGGLLAAAAAGSFALRVTPEVAVHSNTLIKTEFYNLDVHT
ncbi:MULTISPECIES: hypothetical protein [unclassified Bradyrhizobium]|uniref:hypothetical protein n=1 Tax=unclassified Bradyrhizobium TaxID=2631580 RepID=UPI001FFB1F4C|nr:MULTISPECIES: hypothetical protein [unclassified Bradyrhizobium]MCK1305943.1 hypothetical protein [Bradyrhizobium sp. 45]MCK1436200.1 hypothetical protein [Bradyrhizobium sp. 15]